MTSLHVICGLGLPQSKILGTPMNWRLPEKLFRKPVFFVFFLEHLRLWSLAQASSIPVLGLERVCPQKGCPWPWPQIFLCPWPCVLDSTSDFNQCCLFLLKIKFCVSDMIFMRFMNVLNKPLFMVTPHEKLQCVICVSWFLETKLGVQTQRRYRTKYGKDPP